MVAVKMGDENRINVLIAEFSVNHLILRTLCTIHHKQFLAVFDGLTPLYIHFSDTKKTVKAPTKLWVDTVSGDNYVAKKLGEIIGEENVKMK